MAKEVTTYNPQDESVVVYQSADNAVQLNVRVSDETVWLTQQQMADLFGTQRQAITKHVKNIYECAELQPFATSSILEQVQKEGRREVTRQVDIYTKELPKALTLAATKFNDQYGGLTLHQTNSIHDRFLIFDDEKIYLIGASLKDAGKRLFAFTEMSTERIDELTKAL